ncbi:MAG: type II secretion system ATPase GspE [Deltaproteobacteria bacterium]|nr:type II secretion system ATPase GspE [Deltaproteobacteria bacterium]
MAIRRVGLEDLLVESGADPQKLRDARRESERGGISLLEGIERVHAAAPAVVARSLAQMLGLPFRDSIEIDRVEVDLVRLISLAMAREEGFLPLWREGAFVRLAIAEERALGILEDLRLLYGAPVRPFVVPSDVLRDATNKAYDRASRSASAVMDEIVEDGIDEGAGDLNLDADIVDDPNQAPIIKFVNSLLSQAVKDRASDIHIEPFEKELVVRFRVDGVLYEIVKPPPRLQASIVSRVKIMAGLNIAEKRIPQDGRIRTRFAGREIDLRVSTLPVRHGERVVMRILEKGTVFSLDGVGMGKDTIAHFRHLIQRPHGILLVTGPTGSGKTTTLYSALAEINAPDLNILTIEDPIEYELRGIGQTQVNPKIELTFASALRAHLRQDPDVILVGEIRDRETADNAVQASLTGHLVFSTLHTNDAATAFTRLIDMGVEPFLVTSSLIAVLAQRLVRKLCPNCKAPYVPTDAELKEAGITRARIAGHTLYKARGCPACLSTGYKGRSGIYELLLVDDEVRTLVLSGASAVAVSRKARELGMRSLRDDGIRVVMEGGTSLDEVMRVTQEDVSEA